MIGEAVIAMVPWRRNACGDSQLATEGDASHMEGSVPVAQYLEID